jgi:hypothetical protein
MRSIIKNDRIPVSPNSQACHHCNLPKDPETKTAPIFNNHIQIIEVQVPMNIQENANAIV